MIRQAHHERRRVELERRPAEIERGALGTHAWFASSPWAQCSPPTAFSRYRPSGGGYSAIKLQVNNTQNTPLTPVWLSLAPKSH